MKPEGNPKNRLLTEKFSVAKIISEVMRKPVSGQVRHMRIAPYNNWTRGKTNQMALTARTVKKMFFASCLSLRPKRMKTNATGPIIIVAKIRQREMKKSGISSPNSKLASLHWFKRNSDLNIVRC